MLGYRHGLVPLNGTQQLVMPVGFSCMLVNRFN